MATQSESEDLVHDAGQILSMATQNVSSMGMRERSMVHGLVGVGLAVLALVELFREMKVWEEERQDA